MKKFLIEVLVFLVILLTSFYLIFLRADGKTDAFYLRLTTKKQHSLILGNSRAAQAIKPSVLNDVLSRNDLFNYSFSIHLSPYGPTYLNSIKRKLDQDTKDGIFILSVDPWSISTVSADPNDTAKFGELKMFLGKIRHVNLYPNVPYLFSSYDKPYYNLLLNAKSPTTLHRDGWLEVNVTMDSAKVKRRIERKISQYRKGNLPTHKFSEVRLEYLIKTIEYLKNFGKVYLVRLPVITEIMAIEQELIPDFDS
ncbi:MAG: hypothetical protein MUC31_02320, partial [Bacteroidales bacterium]|nr:hypothetical protein [Bacteroidales bacterium]